MPYFNKNQIYHKIFFYTYAFILKKHILIKDIIKIRKGDIPFYLINGHH